MGRDDSSTNPFVESGTWTSFLSSMMARIRRRWSLILLSSILLILTLFLYRRQKTSLPKIDVVENAGHDSLSTTSSSHLPKGTAKPAGVPYTRMLILGRLSGEDISWLDEETLNVNKTVYVVDDAEAENTVPRNKGREAMAYLTYIIDHYDDLADTNMFFHPHLGAWHNNVLLDLNGALSIKKLSDARVAREGYMNARCHHDPGCPNWLHVDRPEAEWDFVKKNEERFFSSAVWRELHGDTPIPPSISQPCCAQFAVSKDRIRSRPKEEYIRYRDWILNTKLTDDVSGRIMEYTWQHIFTGDSEFCPAMHQCYCDGYGICFGGAEQLQAWLNTLREREIADEEYDIVRDQEGEESAKAKSLRKRSNDLTEDLDKRKEKAYQRGEHPKNRALEAGREWHDGDGF